MRQTRFLGACSVVALFCAFAPAQVIVPRGSVWRYVDDGSNQGTAWRGTFDDSKWKSGAAQLGYGDGDEKTVVGYGESPGSKYITTYFRQTFDGHCIAAKTLNLRLLRDDGAVVYLNGLEVFRSNMPRGTIDHRTHAARSVTGGDENTFFEAAIPNLLVDGRNVLAVEVHQSSPSSSDISFDLELRGPDTLVPRGADWKYLDDDSYPADWFKSSFNDAAWQLGSAQLGYGDGDERTLVSFGDDVVNKYVTTLFRHEFTIKDRSAYKALTLSLLRDDGAVVYINDRLAARTNMPTTVGRDTLASTRVVPPAENRFLKFGLDPKVLVDGKNVVAVEVHQFDRSSSDLSFDLELVGADLMLGVTRGPYLQRAAPSSIVVRWRTSVASDTVVWYGTSKTSLTRWVVDVRPTCEHEVEIAGLAAESRYFYGVGSTQGMLRGGDDSHYFRTPPIGGKSVKTRIWVLGDSGTADANAAAVRSAYDRFAGSRHTDVWLMLGDNAYPSGCDDEYQQAVFDMYPTFLRCTPLWPTLGNHDGECANSARQTGPYYDIFTLPTKGEAGGLASGTEAYYSFDHGDIHFICLDSHETDRTPGKPMLNWLQKDLLNTRANWIIAFWHHPPYSWGSHNSDRDMRLIEMRSYAVQELEKAGVDLVLTGHSHCYERSCLLHGHYLKSDKLDAKTMILDRGDGHTESDGAYRKPVAGPRAGHGAIYVVAGCSGRSSPSWFRDKNNEPIPHPVMSRSNFYDPTSQKGFYGSLVLDIDGDRLAGRFLDKDGNVFDQFEIDKGGEKRLWRDLPRVSLAAGGTQNLVLDSGKPNALYVVAGSFGTSPGFSYGGSHIPLNLDYWWHTSLAMANSSPFHRTIGLTDGSGKATPAIVFPRNADPRLLGFVLFHAAIVLDRDGRVQVVSNPEKLRLVR